jgi:hypothetical protein
MRRRSQLLRLENGICISITRTPPDMGGRVVE